MSPRADRLHYAGLSDIGRVRTHNEDAVLLSPPLYAVADGLGGHSAGEIASTVAVEALLAHTPARADAKALGRAVRAANREVIQAAAEGRGRSDMGTTLTAAFVDGDCIAVAHVGDSRAYLLSSEGLIQITQDHSMVADLVRQGRLTEAEAREHPNRSVITRALGSDPDMRADTYEVDAEPGDILLLCTDGLTSMLTDEQIAEILRAYRDPESTVRALIDAANAAGGQDNISAVVVHIEPGNPAGALTARHRSAILLPVLLWLLAGTIAVGAAWWGLNRYARSQAYLISENGHVVLYQGMQGTIAGLELRWLAEETTIPATALEPVTSARLAQGIPVEGLEQGRATLAEYRAQIASDTAETEVPSDEATGAVGEASDETTP